MQNKQMLGPAGALPNVKMIEKQKLEKQLANIEKELDKCRTSALQDGWQTQRYAKKARKWDILAQQKMKILERLDEFNNL